MYHIILREIKERRKNIDFCQPIIRDKVYSFNTYEGIVLSFNSEQECLDYLTLKRNYWFLIGYDAIVAYSI